MTHFIRQQYLEVDLKGSESDGFDLQHRLSDLYYAQLLPAIEIAFDQCSSPDKHVVIDRMDIDTGTIELSRMDQDLTAIVARELIQQIERKTVIRLSESKKETRQNFDSENPEEISNYAHFQNPEENIWNVFIHFLSKGSLPWSYKIPAGKSLEEIITELLINDEENKSSRIPAIKIAEELKSPITTKRLALQFSEHFSTLLHQKLSLDILKVKDDSLHQNLQGTLWEVFIYFLANGSFPIFYHLANEKSLEEALTELLDAHKTKIPVPVSKIAEVLKSPYASKRLVFQFSESFIIKLLKCICPETYFELTSLLSTSEKLSFTTAEIRLFRKFVLEKALLQAFSCRSISKTEIAKQVLDELQVSTDLLPMVSKVFEQAWSEIKMPENDHSSIPSAQIIIDKKGGVSDFSEIKMPENKTLPDTLIADEIVTKEITEGIYIDNAGLVLLHPFLPQFFDALGISNTDEIIKPDKALCLLHYLVTGQTKAPEYELVLPKVMCQVPLSTPVPADAEITENEISEAAALLEAVIKHWEVLQNTTPDGLRGTFLVRPGKLSLKEDGDWLLQVESRTFDVLLEHLPWGISMIKLPWMKNMLWVEWSF